MTGLQKTLPRILSSKISENFDNKFAQNQRKILKNSWQIALKNLQAFCNCQSIKIGCELEFYLLDLNNDFVDLNIRENFIESLNKIESISSHFIIKKEQGQSQIEIESNVFSDLEDFCQKLDFAKEIIFATAKNQNLIANFKAQLNENDCGNSLQFNISFSDFDDKNILNQQSDLINLFSATLLDFTDEIIYLLASNYEDYLRFDVEINQRLFKLGKFCAPVNLSFGLDNRSCAIRIPHCKNKANTRIEYRIASATANHWLSLSAILLILSMVEKQRKLYPITYGNAFDQIYDLKKFVNSFPIAKEKFYNENNIIFKSFKEFIDL